MRSIADAVKWARGMDGKPAPGGPGHCQELVRSAYQLPAWATSAKLAYERIPHDQLHKGDNIHAAPAGAMLYFPTLSDYGHVVLVLEPGKCLSNDYKARGYCTIAPVDLPAWHGAQHYGGWSLWTPFGVAH